MLKQVLVLAVAVVVALGCAQEAARFAARTPASSDAAAPSGAAVAATVADADTAAPSAPSEDAQVRKGAGGHFWAEANVDGRWVHCLIDTGASTVALTTIDAERLGLDPSLLTYDLPLTTANGVVKAARVELPYVSVAGARVEKVDAVVVPSGLTYSLLGMSYLGRLSRFEATPDSLVLRP